MQLPKDCWSSIIFYLSLEDQAALFRSSKWLLTIFSSEWRQVKVQFLRKLGLEIDYLEKPLPFKISPSLWNEIISINHRGVLRAIFNNLDAHNQITYSSSIARFYSEKKDLQHKERIIRLFTNLGLSSHFKEATYDALRLFCQVNPSLLFEKSLKECSTKAFLVICLKIARDRKLDLTDIDRQLYNFLNQYGLLTYLISRNYDYFLNILEQAQVPWLPIFFPQSVREDSKFMNWISKKPLLSVLVTADLTRITYRYHKIGQTLSNLDYIHQTTVVQSGTTLQVFSREKTGLWFR